MLNLKSSNSDRLPVYDCSWKENGTCTFQKRRKGFAAFWEAGLLGSLKSGHVMDHMFAACFAERGSFFCAQRTGGVSPNLTWLNARKCFSSLDNFKPGCESVFIECWTCKGSYSFIRETHPADLTLWNIIGWGTHYDCVLLCYMKVGYFGQYVFRPKQSHWVNRMQL